MLKAKLSEKNYTVGTYTARSNVCLSQLCQEFSLCGLDG